MSNVTLKGNPVHLKGALPEAGSMAPDFTFVKPDLSESSLYKEGARVKVIIAVPSLDTRTCAVETRQFNQKLADMEQVSGLVVSKDLPFAMRRFCETEGIKNVTAASDFRYNEFSQRYNTEIMDSGMKGLSARAIIVVDQQHIVRYTQLVPEIADEPDYEAVLKAVHTLL